MTEQQIQKRRIKELEAEGYYVIKLIKTNKNGIPDLIAELIHKYISEVNKLNIGGVSESALRDERVKVMERLIEDWRGSNGASDFISGLEERIDIEINGI